MAFLIDLRTKNAYVFGCSSYSFQYTLACNMDITYFPFDVQTCPVTFGSWEYDTRNLLIIQVRKIFIYVISWRKKWNVLRFFPNYKKPQALWRCFISH